MTRNEQIWRTVQAAWYKLEHAAIARLFVCHSQVAAAIATHNGGDDFMKEKNALHWGVHKHYAPFFLPGNVSNKPDGVTIVQQPGTPLYDELESPVLRYELPDIEEFYESAEVFCANLKPSEIGMLYNFFPVDNYLSEIVEEAYNMIPNDLGEEQTEQESEVEDEADGDNNNDNNYIYNEAEAEADNLEYEIGFEARCNNYFDDDGTDYDEEELQKVDRLFDDFIIDLDDEE